jgi:hypothetical protein
MESHFAKFNVRQSYSLYVYGNTNPVDLVYQIL